MAVARANPKLSTLLRRLSQNKCLSAHSDFYLSRRNSSQQHHSIDELAAVGLKEFPTPREYGFRPDLSTLGGVFVNNHTDAGEEEFSKFRNECSADKNSFASTSGEIEWGKFGCPPMHQRHGKQRTYYHQGIVVPDDQFVGGLGLGLSSSFPFSNLRRRYVYPSDSRKLETQLIVFDLTPFASSQHHCRSYSTSSDAKVSSDEVEVTEKNNTKAPSAAVVSWIENVLPKQLQPFAHLARLDKPIGTWLLAWPCFW